MSATQHGDTPVLVAVDFSDDSAHAVAWAARQAELEQVPLVVLHVVHDPAASPGFYQKPQEDWLRPMEDVAQEMMTDFMARSKDANPGSGSLEHAATRLVSGLPAGRIVEVAVETHARLVVVGSRGRTGLDSILLGSVAERVVQTCPVPVVVVKAPGERAGK